MATHSETVFILDEAYRAKSRIILARLARMTGDLDIAEDALQDAASAAAKQWPVDGAPQNPGAWLYQVARNKAIDRLNSKRKITGLSEEIAVLGDDSLDLFDDEVLRLIFTCCHPSLAADAQIALTLREVCDLTTEEIAHAFLTPVATVAQRIVRAKSKIREAKIPFEIPNADELHLRLSPVLRTVYLVFNEGYSASSGASALRRDLLAEASRLMRSLTDLISHPEAFGLLALIQLHEARVDSRLDENGDLILLENQDRTKWDRKKIENACRLIESALQAPEHGTYTIQAAITAVHAQAPTFAETDWAEIVLLYSRLLELEPSPVIEVNRAVAIGRRSGPIAGLRSLDSTLERADLSNYLPARMAKATLLAESGDLVAAETEFLAAIRLASHEPERRAIQFQMKKFLKER